MTEPMSRPSITSPENFWERAKSAKGSAGSETIYPERALTRQIGRPAHSPLASGAHCQPGGSR